MTIAFARPTDVESFTAAGCTFRIIDDGGATAGRIGLVQCDLVPGWPGPPQHIHREHDETFYVLTGNVRFTSGGENHVAAAHTLVTVPLADAHTFGNADPDAPASLLCTVAPARYVGYFRELQALEPGTDGRLNPADVLALMGRYATDPHQQ
jgi:mannose-6-phosphate isomerase-like protein (cupin superfamily)